MTEPELYLIQKETKNKHKREGENKMRTYEEINTIMNNISKKTRKTISEMWESMILDMGEDRRDARRRFLSDIKKIGLTEKEYEMWRIK